MARLIRLRGIISTLTLIVSVAYASCAELALVGLREDPKDQTGEEALIELVSLGFGEPKSLGTFRVPGVMSSGSVVATTNNAMAYFATAAGPSTGDGFCGTKLFRIATGRNVRVDALSFPDRFVKKIWTVPQKVEALAVHIGGSVTGIGPQVDDTYAAYTWIDMRRDAGAQTALSIVPGSGAADLSGRSGSPGATFSGKLATAIMLTDFGVSEAIRFALPDAPTPSEASKIDGGFVARSPGGSLAVVGNLPGPDPHGPSHQVFVYSHRAAKWIKALPATTQPVEVFFLQDELLAIASMKEIDLGGQKQWQRTGRYHLVNMTDESERDLNLGAASPVRALNGGIVALEGVTGKKQRVLLVKDSLKSSEVLYETTAVWWQAYCLESEVRAESFSLSASREEIP